MMENPLWSALKRPPREQRDKIALLETLSAFEGLQRTELMRIERRLHLRRYRPGEEVFSEGMPGVAMYIVQEGNIVISKEKSNNPPLELAVISSGSFFGEIALIDESPRSATARARDDTTVLAFCRSDLEKLSERSPKLVVKILTNISRLLCRRLVATNAILESKIHTDTKTTDTASHEA